MRLVVEIGKKYPQITGPLADAFASELARIVDSTEFTELVLDFSGMQILSSMAIGAVFSTQQKLKEQNRSIQIINAAPKVVHLLQMVNMADILR